MGDGDREEGMILSGGQYSCPEDNIALKLLEITMRK
jgi:hypothetical protein